MCKTQKISHKKNMLNTCPILLNLVTSPLSSTWRKRTYTKILQNCQHAHHGNQQACITVASLVELLIIPSTIWIQVVLTALASTSLCMATVLIPIFLHVLMTYHIRSDNYQYLKYQQFNYKKLKRLHTYSACNLPSVCNKEFFKSLKGKEQ